MRVRNVLLAGMTGLWLVGVLAGMVALWHYSLSSGVSATAPTSWPFSSTIERNNGRYKLILFVHPSCSCSRATISELAEILTRAQDIDVSVLFVYPPGFDRLQALPDLQQAVLLLPGVKVVTDDAGVEARRFGAATSGQGLLFDRRGELVFSGGITPSRGHAGDNEGRRAIVALASAGFKAYPSTPVFGCPLFSAHPDCEEGMCPKHQH